MKSKKNYILNVIIIFLLCIILVVSILGGKTRVGYFNNIKINIYETLKINNIDVQKVEKIFSINNCIDEKGIINYIFTNENIKNYSYNFRIDYHSKIFRNSDIYGVHLQNERFLPQYIKKIEMDNDYGSPFGILVSTEKVGEKIDNIDYSLKIKLHIKFILLLIICFLILLKLDNHFYFNKAIKYIYSNKMIFILALIFVFAASIRIYYSTLQKDFYWDESHGLRVIYNQDHDRKEKKNISSIWDPSNNTVGAYIIDMLEMYKYTHDPYISNFYYSFLRTILLLRFANNITEIVVLGTILNTIFFLISYIFMYKILKMLIKKKDIIIFSMLCTSLIPSSISFSMFIRPYQLQETLFIVMSYLVIYIWKYEKFSTKYYIYMTLICSFLYLTLFSSIIFVLILSFFIFIFFIMKYKKELIKNIKKLLFFASSFFLAFPVAWIFYDDFFNSLLTANTRAEKSIHFPSNVLGFINYLCFIDILFYIIIFFAVYFIFILLKNKIKNESFNMTFNFDIFYLITIILTGIIFSIYSDSNAPYDYPRYSVSSFPLVFLFVSVFIYFIKNKYIRYTFMIILSSFYIYNIMSYNNFDYFENKTNYYTKETLLFAFNDKELKLYSIAGHFGYHNKSILHTPSDRKLQKLKNYDELSKKIKEENPDRFFVINNLDLTLDINSKFSNACIGYSNINKVHANRYIFEFVKITN